MAAMILLCLALAVASPASAATVWGGATSLQEVAPVLASRVAGVGAFAAVGSGAGVAGLLSKSYLLAASDDPLTAAQDASAKAVFRGNALTIPICVASYSFFVHANGGSLTLNAAQTFGLYKGNVQWGGVKGAAALGLSGRATAFSRAENSGTTKLITIFWSTALGSAYVRAGGKVAGSPLTFATKAQPKSSGMLSSIRTTGNSIGYLQTGIGAGVSGLVEVALVNRAGIAVKASVADLYQSIYRSLPPPNLSWNAVSLVLIRGRNTYPIVSFEYNFIRPNFVGANADPQGKIAKKLLYFIITAGQGIISQPRFGFKPVPNSYRSKWVGYVNAIRA